MQTEISKDSIEQTHAFFHQKWRVYQHSLSENQRDDIEYAIAQYVEQMSRPLYDLLADGHPHFLFDHQTFAADISYAVDRLEEMMETK